MKITDTEKQDIEKSSEQGSVSFEAENVEPGNTAGTLEDPSTLKSDESSKLKFKYCEKKVADKLVERLINEGIIY